MSVEVKQFWEFRKFYANYITGKLFFILNLREFFWVNL